MRLIFRFHFAYRMKKHFIKLIVVGSEIILKRKNALTNILEIN